MSKKKKCLNCENELADKFCSSCGQKSDTQRITFKNFVFHDILHGTFHIDKGIPFTAKQALLCPGKASIEYIAGKRKRYYNVFYLILITFGLIVFFRHFLESLDQEEVIKKTEYLNQASSKMNELFSQKSKLIVLLFVPLAALNGFLLFKSKKLNLSEHFIISGMILLGMLLISLFGNLFYYINLIIPFNTTFSFIMSWLITLLIIFHIGYGYFNAFSNDYSKSKIVFKIVLFYTLFILELSVLFMLTWGFLSNWKYGALNFSPFG